MNWLDVHLCVNKFVYCYNFKWFRKINQLKKTMRHGVTHFPYGICSVDSHETHGKQKFVSHNGGTARMIYIRKNSKPNKFPPDTSHEL